MGIEATATDFVTAGLRHHSLTKTRQQRSNKHDAATQRSRLLAELIALQYVEIHLVSLELERATAIACRTVILADTHTQKFQNVYQFVHIADIGHMLYTYFLAGQQYGTKHLQRLVFGTLRHNLATQLVTTYDFKTAHFFFFFFFLALVSFLAAAAALASM